MAKTISNQLIIYFHDADGELVSWAIRKNGDKNFTSHTGRLADIKTKESFQHVIVLVPSTALFITTVTLPGMSSAQQAQAALYVLEEQLADDVQELHAAVIPQDNQQHHTVIIIQKSLLKIWLTKLKENNILPTLVLPDIFALPQVSEGWSVLLWKKLAWIRTGPKTGFSIEVKNLSHVINELPARIEIRNYSTDPVPDALNTNPNAHMIIHDNPHDIANFLLSQDFNNEGNLLSGEFTSAFDKAYLRKRWKTPVVLSMVLLLMYASTATAKWLYLNHENNIVQKQVAELYWQVFPNASSIISPKLRIQQELQNKQQTLTTDDFLYLVAQAGSALRQITAVNLESVSFQDGELILNVQSKTVADLDALQSQLKKQAISVEQKETSSTKTGVSAQFHIKRAT